MPPSLIGKVSQRLRSLIRGNGDPTVPYEAEIATSGMFERVRDEWQARGHASADERFGLVQLLKTLAVAPNAPPPAAATHRRPEGPANDGALRSFDTEFLARTRYRVDEFTGASDTAFLELAYRCVLKRAPDPTGSQQLLLGMEAGTLERIDVLHALNASYEGRNHGVVIAGLRLRWLWRRAERVPVAGPAVAWLRALFSVAVTRRRLKALEARVDARHEEQMALDATRSQADAAVSAITDRFRRMQAESRLQTTTAAADARDMAARLQRLEAMLDDERARVDALCAAIEGAAAVGSQGPQPTTTR